MKETLMKVAEATVLAFALVKLKYGLPDEAMQDFTNEFEKILFPNGRKKS